MNILGINGGRPAHYANGEGAVMDVGRRQFKTDDLNSLIRGREIISIAQGGELYEERRDTTSMVTERAGKFDTLSV